MFNRKAKTIQELTQRNEFLRNRVREVEDILCPFNQHNFVQIDRADVYSYYSADSGHYTQRVLQCHRCKKIVHDNNYEGDFKYTLKKEADPDILSQIHSIICRYRKNGVIYSRRMDSDTSCVSRLKDELIYFFITHNIKHKVEEFLSSSNDELILSYTFVNRDDSLDITTLILKDEIIMDKEVNQS